MALRLIIVMAALLFAVGGFLGAGPTPGGLTNPFGWLFLGIAALVWLEWQPMRGGLEQRPGIWDAFSRNILGIGKDKTSSSGSGS